MALLWAPGSMEPSSGRAVKARSHDTGVDEKPVVCLIGRAPGAPAVSPP